MNLQQFTPLEEYIQKHWDTFQDVADHINKDPILFFEGEGVIIIQTELNGKVFKDYFYLFQINNSLYGTSVKESRETKEKYFDGIYLLSESVLKSSTFREAVQINPSTRYKDLAVKIEIECKPYTYHDEHKLLLTKSQKVDLLYSHKLNMDNINNTIQFESKAYPSLKQAVTWQKMVDRINERTADVIAKRKAGH